jgi:anti-anti-sigma factor
MDDELTVTCDVRDGVIRLTVDGPVLATTAEQLRDDVDRELGRHDGLGLEVDLAGVPLLDSSGISVLLTFLSAADRAGGHLAVLNPRPHVFRALQVLGLLDVLRVRSDRPAF